MNRQALVDMATAFASSILEQRQRQRGRKIYSLHALEVESIGKGGPMPL